MAGFVLQRFSVACFSGRFPNLFHLLAHLEKVTICSTSGGPLASPPSVPCPASHARAQGYGDILLSPGHLLLCMPQNYLAALFKHKVLGPTPRGSDSAHLRWGLRIFIPNTFPDKLAAAGPGPTAGELPPTVAVRWPCFPRQAECTHCSPGGPTWAQHPASLPAAPEMLPLASLEIQPGCFLYYPCGRLLYFPREEEPSRDLVSQTPRQFRALGVHV